MAAGQALFDQAFDALGQETDGRLPPGDHQNSTRVLLGHDAGGAVVVRIWA